MNELASQIIMAANAIAFGIVIWQLARANTIANNARNVAEAANTQTANTALQLQALRGGIDKAIARLPKTRSRKPKPAISNADADAMVRP